MLKLNALCRLRVLVPLFGLTLSATSALAQVGGAGWIEYTPKKQYNGGVEQNQRYTNSDGIEHFWILSTDPSAFPGQDSGPRSEWRVFNDYTKGTQQFQADFNVESGTSSCTVFQIFGATSRATSLQLQMRSNNGTLRHYNDTIICTGCWGVYHRLNVIHNTATGNIDVYVNGAKASTFPDGGQINHYFKYGVYATASVTARAGIYYKNVKYFKKG